MKKALVATYMGLSLSVRNIIGTGAVYSSFLILLWIMEVIVPMGLEPPDPSRTEWFRWYVWGVVPVIGTLVAYFLLHGSLGTRLGLLNLAVAAATVTETIRAVTSDPDAAMALPLVPLFVAALCAGVSVLFIIYQVIGVALGKRARPVS